MHAVQTRLGCSDVLFLLFISFVEAQAVPEHRDLLLGLQTHQRSAGSTVRGHKTGKLFWCIFVISMLLALFAYLVGCRCGGTWQRLPPGDGGWGASPGCRAALVRQGTCRFARGGGVTNSWVYCSLWCLIVQGGTNFNAVPSQWGTENTSRCLLWCC